MYLKRFTAALAVLFAIVSASPASAQSTADRQILIELYESTNGAAWYRNRGWLDDTNHCNWSGISCTDNRITTIRLARNNLSGPLPEEVFELEMLQHLLLSDNNLTGPLPPATLNALQKNARTIDLGGNQFSGNLPAFTRQDGPGDHVKIDLADNQLSGPIPPSWVDMRLGSIDLSDNALESTLAETWKVLPNASRIFLAGTGLTGKLPESPARFEGDSALVTRLEQLDLSRNQLQGELPGWMTELTLLQLSLHHNAFSGPIHAAVDAMSQDRDVLIDLANNQFSGSIPSNLSQLRMARTDSLMAGGGHRAGLNLCWNELDPASEALLEFINPRHHGGSYENCQQPREPVSLAISGSRYDPQRSGEGFVQHVLDNGRILLFWFTYPLTETGSPDVGQQAWFLSVTSPLEQSLWLERLLQPSGQFGQGSDGFQTPTFWLSVNPLGTARQQIAYSREYVAARSMGGIPIDSLMSMRHDQVALTRLAGTTCDNQQPHQWISGAWYDPERSGEGFVIEVNQDGRVVVYWFTYKPHDFGRQAWMIGTGEFVDSQVVIEKIIQPVGTMFGPDFDESEIEHIDWGRLTIEFDGEDAGHIWYESNLNDYGSGNYPIERLARPMQADCDGVGDQS